MILEILQNIALALILAGVCAALGFLLKTNKQRILELTTDLVQKAESVVTGSGMGPEKKAKVITQLEAMGIKVTDWLDDEIDAIVDYLNDKGGWFVDEAAAAAKDAIDDLAE